MSESYEGTVGSMSCQEFYPISTKCCLVFRDALEYSLRYDVDFILEVESRSNSVAIPLIHLVYTVKGSTCQY